MPEIYSHSRLENFEKCPRRFQYRYRLGLPPESESIEAFVGKRVHEVLERLYKAGARGIVPTLEQVMGRYRQLFDDAYDPQKVRIPRIENDLRYYRDLGEHCLANYYHDHYPFDGDETLGVEERVHFEVGKLDGEPVQLQGFIDRVVRARDGVIEIHDYKTSARAMSQAAVDKDRQLALYQIGVSERMGRGPFRLVWHFLQRGITRTSTRTADQLESLREETLDRVSRIRNEKEWPARTSTLCRWCEYRDGCSASPVRREDVPPYERRPKVQAKLLALESGTPPAAVEGGSDDQLGLFDAPPPLA